MTDVELLYKTDEAVRYLCNALAETRSEASAPAWASMPDMMEHRIKQNGRLMQWLGDVLNGMDAVEEDDEERTAEAFEAINARYPDSDKEPQLFLRSNQITDGVWWHCGGPDLGSAIQGLKCYLSGNEELIGCRDLEFDIRLMTEAEVSAIPEC